MHVLLEDDQGSLTIQRLRPWGRLMARCLAARLDRELAGGTRPETTRPLAVRAIRLTSMEFRRDLATSLQRILAAAGLPVEQARTRGGAVRALPAPAHRSTGVARPPYVPVRRTRISRSAPELAELAGQLVQPGPVPARGVAIVSQLLADGRGPLYREACPEDLGAIAGQAVRALNRLPIGRVTAAWARRQACVPPRHARIRRPRGRNHRAAVYHPWRPALWIRKTGRRPAMRCAPYDLSVSAAWADALFASALQRSDEPSAGQVEQAVAAAMDAFGDLGCAGRVAQAYGEDPEMAVTRMRWACTAVTGALSASWRVPAPRSEL
jgi:hypothetical protein